MKEKEDLKRCSNCKIQKLVINFNKDSMQKDRLYNQCKVCRKQHYTENQVKLKKCFFRKSKSIAKQTKIL